MELGKNLTANIALATIIFSVDLLCLDLPTLGMFYVANVILALWLPKIRYVYFFALLTSILILMIIPINYKCISSLQYELVNRSIIIMIIWLTCFMTAYRKNFASQAQNELSWLSNHDELTNLYNRRYFNSKILKIWRRMQREQTSIGIIMVDIDYFKKYNDSLGHQAGDKCLKRVSKIIENSLRRADDFASRYGGEEFVIILPNTTLIGTIKIAENIKINLEKENISHGSSELSNKITVSMGIANLIPRRDQESDILIRQADHALYRAKHTGRNKYIAYNDLSIVT